MAVLTRLEQIQGGTQLKIDAQTAKATAESAKNKADALEKIKQAKEKITVGADKEVSFVLANIPTEETMILTVNHLQYLETECFTVNRATKTVTWTFTAESGGFDLLADFDVTAVYKFIQTPAV